MAIYRGPGGSGDATTDAANQASVASNKAAEAAISATAAAGSASSAATSASTATTRASEASTSATNASNSETAAASSATDAAASYDSFDDRYLGAKSSDPTLDNDGDALSAGALYFNTVSNVMQTYTGSAWQSINTGTGLQASNNLSDVLSASTSRDNLGLTIGTDIQAFDSVLAATTASYTTAEESKLAGIETAATIDQTGAEIKAAYEVEANAFTDTQFTKLSGIETSATADQTAGEIKTAYESNADTNAFTDANSTKLSGIETSADVTDATNVTVAGALMDSEVTNLAQVKAFDTTDYATAAQGTLAASALQSADIGSSVQAFDADTLKADTADTLTAPFRGTVTADNDLSFDLNVTNNFSCTPSGAGTLTFTNHTAGQSGFIWLDNSGGHAIAAAATTKINAADLTAISTAGVFTLSYFDNGTNAYVSASRSFG